MADFAPILSKPHIKFLALAWFLSQLLLKRQDWTAEAKRQGTTMTAVIISALTAKFGKPQ